MKQKGFTLAELLAVIALIGLIGLVVIPSVNKAIKNSKQELFQNQIKTIENAARNWAAINTDSVPIESGESVTITIGQLKQMGHLELDLRDPRNNQKISNLMPVVITKYQNSFIYYLDSEHLLYQDNKEYTEDAPILILNGTSLTYVEITKTLAVYEDAGVIAKTKDGTIIPDQLVSKTYLHGDREVSQIPTNDFNTYTIQYSTTDRNLVSTITRTVIIRDTTAPIVEVPENTILKQSEVAGFNLKNDVIYSDNDPNGTITLDINSTLSNVTGKYIITYTATDQSGNIATKRRLITVTS